jgi:hypothetical protein
MNCTEVDAMVGGLLLKSSLEIYAPLDGLGTMYPLLTNLAQSTNTIQKASATFPGNSNSK